MGAFGKYSLSQSDKGWGLRNLIIPEYLCAACSCSQPESSAPVPLRVLGVPSTLPSSLYGSAPGITVNRLPDPLSSPLST